MDKKTRELENKKMERLERLKNENEMLDYFNTYEYEIEIEISTRELLNDVISDIMKF